MDAIFKFHKCGFETCTVVSDGASSNLTKIKELTGAERKAYGYVCILIEMPSKLLCIVSAGSIRKMIAVISSQSWFLNPYTDVELCINM